jgi:hypothetical protein
VQIRDFGGTETRREISRQLTWKWQPRSTTAVQLADTSTMRERLAAAYRLALPLLQAFGVPELPWLNASGEIRPGNMRTEHRANVRAWLRNNPLSETVPGEPN